MAKELWLRMAAALHMLSVSKQNTNGDESILQVAFLDVSSFYPYQAAGC
jgi:hypothetical protein